MMPSAVRIPFRRFFIAGVVLLALAAIAHPAPAWAQARSFWDDSTVPGTLAVTIDSSSVELGVKFRSDAHGWITGMRFYKGAGNSGIHIGSLWTASGSL